jgi:hypothetical protein
MIWAIEKELPEAPVYCYTKRECVKTKIRLLLVSF